MGLNKPVHGNNIKRQVRLYNSLKKHGIEIFKNLTYIKVF